MFLGLLLMRKETRTVILSSIGGSLEFFDFTIYALFAPYIRQVFFPAQDAITGLLSTFGVFALGYLARPLGGIIFGYLGDCYGRCIAFSSCIFIMAVSTLFIGLLPGYNNIGVAAPIVLTLLRIIQGISVGGEIPGSCIFTAEHLFKKRRGLAIGIIFMFITLGNFWGSALGYVLEKLIKQPEMLNWGWRIPFIIGFVVGILSYFLRKKVYETSIYNNMKESDKIEKFPLLTLIRKKPGLILVGFGLTALSAATVSFILYLPSYLTVILGEKAASSYLVTTCGFLTLAFCSMVFGFISDCIGRKLVIITGAVLSAICGYAAFYMVTHTGGGHALEFAIWIAATVGIVNGVYGISITELFPANVRASGMGLSFNMGLALIGGLSPFLFTYFIKITGSLMAPYYIFGVCAVITCVSGIFWKSRFSCLDR
ncbi:MAG: MHS family MFS transporter [Lentisphaerae bacterium]|nr:MHS family MFS transporter [Lentisphaerota bacterium]MCP4103161.1 MHS family MFS transporter [Lentisphaerota bacterium]